MSSVNRAGPVPEFSPRHSFLRSFISKVTRVHKVATEVISDEFIFHNFVLFLGLPSPPRVHRAEISHMNRQKNSSRYPSQPGYRAPMKRPAKTFVTSSFGLFKWKRLPGRILLSVRIRNFSPTYVDEIQLRNTADQNGGTNLYRSQLW